MLFTGDPGNGPWKHPVEASLFEAIKAIAEKDAREEGLLVLEDVWLEQGPSSTHALKTVWKLGQGLEAVARTAKGELALASGHPLIGPAALARELDELRASMLELAGRLNGLSPGALEWISILPFAGPYEPPHRRDGSDSRIPEAWRAWTESNAAAAFPVQDFTQAADGSPWPVGPQPHNSVLAVRLKGMAKILEVLIAEADDFKAKTPGAQSVFRTTPPDLGIFAGCAMVLRARGRELTHLRTIASTIYEWATGKAVLGTTWAKREENQARQNRPPIK